MGVWRAKDLRLPPYMPLPRQGYRRRADNLPRELVPTTTVADAMVGRTALWARVKAAIGDRKLWVGIHSCVPTEDT